MESRDILVKTEALMAQLNSYLPEGGQISNAEATGEATFVAPSVDHEQGRLFIRVKHQSVVGDFLLWYNADDDAKGTGLVGEDRLQDLIERK